ncbi:MAG: cupredoxin domain-containing protein [Actinobacteria bacterium]|nr:cupredoxin domain-containing protein [Actinomycetota bacterium]
MGFVILLLSILILAAGVGLAVATFASGKRSAHAVLSHRLASGDIDVEEYKQRLAALGPSRAGAAWVPAVILIAIGLIGVLVFAFSSMGKGPMRNMMGGMGGMMNGGMDSMMRGRTDLTAPEPSPGASEVVITAKEFLFAPREIKVKRGETVNLVLDNRGEAFHTLTIEKLDFQIETEGGRRASGALTADRSGSFTVICSVPGHEEAGMRATLIVE